MVKREKKKRKKKKLKSFMKAFVFGRNNEDKKNSPALKPTQKRTWGKGEKQNDEENDLNFV